MTWSLTGSVRKPIVGMLHLRALPGAPRSTESLDGVVERALADARALADGGCHALMMENFGDVPFYPGRVPAYVTSSMTRVACEVRRAHPHLPLGINVLRNDGLTALAIAHACGADFIRVNVLGGARVTDQGVIEGIAHELLRERRLLGAERIGIMADVDVKHSAPLAARGLAEEVQDMLKRGLADAIVVSGTGTGAGVDLEQLARAKATAGAAPVVIGSGATPETLAGLAKHADIFIVGTAMKVGGVSTAAVDPKRVAAMMAAHGALS